MIKVTIKWEEGREPDKKTGTTIVELPDYLGDIKSTNLYHEGYCYWCHGIDYYTDERGIVLRASRYREDQVS
ncbi:MAG: hypothetical protein KDD43_00435 [Bdellovibrionales bacterium]|nr:hypothetical protein [Bdellovibrionales bacterium]